MHPNLLNLSPEARAGVWLVVDFFTDPARETEAAALFEQHAQDGRRDAGNLAFFVMKDEKEPGRFTSLECWVNQAAIENHDAQPHHPVFLANLADLQTREKQVRFLSFAG